MYITLIRRHLAAVLVLVAAVVAPLSAQNASVAAISVDSADNETPELWFIEFASLPSAAGGSKNAVKAERDAFSRAANAAGIRFRERRAFDTLWNGISVAVKPAELARISRMPEVKNIYPIDIYQLPAPGEDNLPQLSTAVAMTGANIVRASGLTGAGIRVGIIDTGIDIDHPDLGGSGVNGTTPFPTAKIPHGYDFVGDAWQAGVGLDPMPDSNPDDTNGHGTHVAGIVGANGVIKGVAPGVTLGAYRVFGTTGSTTADIMLAAMELALADGMHVVNMSIGSAFQWPQYPTAVAADRLVENGVVVVCSIGNSGTNGVYGASAPGVGANVIGVASFENTHNELRIFTVSPDATPIGYGPATGSQLAPLSGTVPLARTGTPASTNDAGLPLPPGSLDGQVALIRRGTSSFYLKALNAQNAGAIGVVLYNNAPGRINPTVTPPTAANPVITIPVVAISDVDGISINDRIAAGPTSMTWTGNTAIFPAPATVAGLIASSSSYGLAPDLSIKPDIGAPGGNIYSTYPLELGGAVSISGTSMASPHVAGGAALYLQAHPGTAASAMRGILLNTAQPKAWWANPGLGFLDNVHRQGAGMLAIDRALSSRGEVAPEKLALGESEAGPATRTLTIKNHGGLPVTYSPSHIAAISTGANSFVPSFFISSATATFSPASISVPAGGSATVNVALVPASSPNKGVYGGYLLFTPSDGGEVLRVPYGGFIGDYQSVQVLTPTANGFPWLGQLVNGSYFNRPAGGVYTMQGDDIPFLLVHFDHPSRALEVKIYEAGSGKPVHPVFHTAFREEYLPRNSTASGFFTLAWDGTRDHNNGNDRTKLVPNGRYILKLTVLKALGDPTNPAHLETWTSPVITIARP
jgi:subtilisin family serine protease